MERALFIAICCAGIVLLLRLMIAPIRWVWKLSLNAICAFGILILLNLVGKGIGVSFGLNLWSILATTLLGLPGIGLMLFAKLIL